MAAASMVLVATVPTEFEAHVVAARLGAAGLLWQLKGNVGGPYPLGPVHVLVAADDAGVARELLLADEVEALFAEAEAGADDDPEDLAGARRRIGRRRGAVLAAAGALAVVAVRVVVDVLSGGVTGASPPHQPPVQVEEAEGLVTSR